MAQFGALTGIPDVSVWGSTLIVAPHPDDESLGAGGAIALLRDAGVPVYGLFVSDGSQSHPHSPAYPASRLRDLREAEAREALLILGVSPEAATFMRLPDTQVPTPGDTAFAGAVDTVVDLIRAVNPQTVLVPWRRDPHRDHRATWHILHHAVGSLTTKPRVLEYPIWLWELGHDADQPRSDEVRVLKLSIDSAVSRKKQAIATHRSQVTRLIDDDPTAFYLSPNLLAHFDVPHELFFESI
ncbi:MAG: PIG-L family deacetylase [Bacteroidetes bacterium]|nr:PIG-L family deacetylase [Fibrella sp.]